MANYYAPPPSGPFAGANLSPRPDYYQRPPSRPTLIEQVQANPPDAYTTIPVPLPPTPSTNFKNPRWQPSSPQVTRSPKTFLQWKADSKARTVDYQLNGYPSPVVWVMTSFITPYLLSFIGCYLGLRRRPRNSPQCCHWRRGPQRTMVYRQIVL